MAGGATYRVSNETNKRLTIQASDGRQLTLAPLEHEREVSLKDQEAFGLREYEQRGYISLANNDESVPLQVWPLAAILCGWFSLIYAAIGLVGQQGAMYWLVGACTVVGLVCLGVLLKIFGANFQRHLPKRLMNSAMRQLSFLMALGIAVLLPSVLVLLTTGLWQRIQGDQATTSDFYSELACRFLHLLFISILSLLPAMLFFVLDRECMATLRSKFTRQIFRFDPEVTNKQDIRSKYGSLLNEAYGPANVASSGRVLAPRRSPVLLATLVITIGWSLTFLSGASPPEHSDIQGLVSSLFAPQKSLLTFGFLGSYFYALQTAFRSYVYRDLRPKAYSHITVRIVGMLILAWVLSLLGPQQGNESPPSWLLVLVFMTGIVPETGLVLLQDFLRSSILERWRGTKQAGPSPVDEHEPLTDLDGIDLYDRSRLLDEGVTNVQSLAHHDLVELMMLTRIPAPRLLDWVDQAILHLRVSEGDSPTERRQVLARLQEYGIRTATDLENACKSGELRKQLERLFPSKAAVGEAGATGGRLQSILHSMKDEAWMLNLRYWRKRHPVEELVLTCPEKQSHSLRALSGPSHEKDIPSTGEAGIR